MRIKRLYIKDYFCYSHAFIDFEQFSSALIVGKKDNNDDISNGVGKTTIFKAMEYALFNHSDVNLENIIRDEQDLCSITVDFEVNQQEYRITRTRTRKGITDITLFRRTTIETTDQTYHTIHNDIYQPQSLEQYWEDISGRRSADTEKEITKLIKVNIKSFRIFVHFMQNDLTGLTTATPEKRKVILRDALSLSIYAKLEKLAKEQFSTLTKEADKLSTTIETLGDPDKLINLLTVQSATLQDQISIASDKLTHVSTSHAELTDVINKLTNKHSDLEGKFSSLLTKKTILGKEKSSIENSVKEYQTKKTNIIKVGKDLKEEIEKGEQELKNLSALDYSQIETLTEQIVANKEQAAQLSLTIKNDTTRCNKLSKPIPIGAECEECRQVITKEHRTHCQAKLDQELTTLQLNVKNCHTAIANLTAQNTTYQQSISSFKLSQQQLQVLTSQLAIKTQDLLDKRAKHAEYKGLFDKFSAQLIDKTQEVEQLETELQQSSLAEAKLLQQQITAQKQSLNAITQEVIAHNQQINQLNNQKAIVEYDLQQKTQDRIKKINLTQQLKVLQEKLVVYPLVVQAFSSSGIPNLVIQNVLDDLQIEANNLLAQLKPGIQLSFAIEKNKGDTEELTDTLDINYLVGGRKRYYEQLSGGMRLAVSFALKLGLSFLLQKMLGVHVKLLLLDELDQSLDKSSVDMFADIVRFFQKDYTILVITHNHQLKDKFGSAILVQQNQDMVSTASVVSAW